jgi:hypothetical protein
MPSHKTSGDLHTSTRRHLLEYIIKAGPILTEPIRREAARVLISDRPRAASNTTSMR